MSYLEGLNDRQKEAVLHTEGPLLIVAGAGAGKTTTITRRIAHLLAVGAPPASILAVTFTNKAAGEMRSRIAALIGRPLPHAAYGTGGPLVTTFHSLGVRLLREFSNEARIPAGFSIWDRDDSMRAIKRLLVARGLEKQYPPRQVLARISREKGEGVEAEALRDGAVSPYERAIGDVWTAYEKAKTAEAALDFDDLLAQTLNLLTRDSAVLERLQERYRFLTIDEYQDTNRIQYEIARLLTGKRNNICAVGDVDQCIYTWRSATIENLLSFERTFPGTKVVLLEQNYRSTQTILTAANAVIEKNRNRVPKRLVTDNPTGEAISLFAGDTERDEATFVARTARSLIASGTPASEIAVLFRENFQSRALEEACIAANIPYRVLGTRFFERAEVKDVLAYIKAARNPSNIHDFTRAVAVPSRGIGKTTLDKVLAGHEASLPAAARTKLEKFRSQLSTMAHAIATQKASDALRFVVAQSGIEKMLSESPDDEGRLGNVSELISHASRYDTLPAPQGIDLLLEDAALMSEQDSLAAPDAQRKPTIALMTVHAAKGLEFDVVFVTGLEHGLFPSIRKDDGDRDPEEERRLFYVALTRARKNLFLTLAGSRLKYGSREHTYPSEFLTDIDQRLLSYADVESSYEPIISL